jgi:hypothetical protein
MLRIKILQQKLRYTDPASKWNQWKPVKPVITTDQMFHLVHLAEHRSKQTICILLYRFEAAMDITMDYGRQVLKQHTY